MSTGLYLLVAGLVIAALIGIFWWMRSRSTRRSRAKRKQPLFSREVIDQPWEHDKDDGRGNR